MTNKTFAQMLCKARSMNWKRIENMISVISFLIKYSIGTNNDEGSLANFLLQKVIKIIDHKFMRLLYLKKKI